jgi:hypothetical protein
MKKEIGSTGTKGHQCTAGVTHKEEKRSEKLTRLAREASDLDDEIQYSEGRITTILYEIKKMNPTKREINYRGLQYLLDCYDV